jgi:hypothetical protein
MQAHPELSSAIIQGIIDRLHSVGRLNVTQKELGEEHLEGGGKKLRRHAMLRIIAFFLGIFDDS